MFNSLHKGPLVSGTAEQRVYEEKKNPNLYANRLSKQL